MQYLINCIRRQGEGETSLLLQQYLCRKLPACFACLCTSKEESSGKAGRYFTGQLLLWCRRFPWHRAVRRPDIWLKRAERELAEEIRRSLKKIETEGLPGQNMTVSWRILLGVGEEILIMGNGQKSFLLSMSMGRGVMTQLEGSFRGRLESGAGILMTTDNCLDCCEEEAAEVLLLSELQTKEQSERHLKELMNRVFEAREGDAAILLVTKENDYV